MSEENKTLFEQVESTTPESDEQSSDETNDQFKEAVEEQLKKIRTQSMLLGSQTVCQVVLQKIVAWEMRPGKRTLNDHRRLIKDIKRFCEIGISKQVNSDGTISLKNEDNTKLTEEENNNE